MWTHDAGPGRAGPLFTCTTAEGTWAFVALPGGCELLRDGKRVASGDASPASVGRVLDDFLRVARVRGAAAEDAAGPQVRPAAEADPPSHGLPGPP